MSMSNEDRLIKRDRMRYIKNKSSANLAYLAILLDVIYFVSIYQSDVETWYYRWIIGISIVYNLIFMLAAFLSSEGVKNYQKNYTFVELALGVIQFVRIFILPVPAYNATLTVGDVTIQVMHSAQFTLCVVCLIASGVCLIVSGVINYIKCNELAAHMKSLENQNA